MQSIAALVGNGLSIAYNSDLTMPNINSAIIRRLDEAPAGTLTAKIMQDIARKADRTGDLNNFEVLFGPLDVWRDGLTMIKQLAVLAEHYDEAEMVDALDRSADFIDQLRRWGVGHALDVIADRSVAHIADRHQIDKFITSVIEAAGGGRVTFGNLNYDALVMSSLVFNHQSKLCDMTDGRGLAQFEVVPGMGKSPARPLRVTADFPLTRRITLLHLHGSLAWLRNPEDNKVYRFDIDDLRWMQYWSSWLNGDSAWTPEVVLTNQSTKSSVVKKYPFSLAYSAFEERLREADRWLIAGYSFGDECVNDMLAAAFARHRTVPKIIVVTHGDQPTVQTVLEALKFNALEDPDPADFLAVTRMGIEFASVTQKWTRWASEGDSVGRAS